MSVPLAILGGFLGSGKTTVLNHILRHATSRIGVLVNDFGAVNIDAELITARDGGVISLSNGCVCCSLGTDLSGSLAAMLARDPAPERIVIEASGVSDPWRIAQVAMLEADIALDAVLVLADAAGFTAHLADRWLTDTLERQLARADLILISKCDLADDASRAATREAIMRVRPDARVAEIAYGAIPDILLTGPHDEPSSRFAATPPDHTFRSWHWRSDSLLDEAKLRLLLARLPDSVLRGKGFCRVGPSGEPRVMQLVGKRWTLRPWDGETIGGIVLIGDHRLPPDAELAVLFDGVRLR